MNETILDQITAAFVGALQTGIGALTQYSLPLLAVLGTIALYLSLSHATLSSGVGAGDALAAAILSILKVGVFYWLLVNWVSLTTATLTTFLQWGIAPTGGGISAQTVLA